MTATGLPFLQTGREPIEKDPLLQKFDEFFPERVSLIAEGATRLVVTVHPTTNRKPNDLTLLENFSLPIASPFQTRRAVAHTKRNIINIGECVETVRSEYRKYGLDNPGSKTVWAFCHDQLGDFELGRRVFTASEYENSAGIFGGDIDLGESTSFVSKLLAYADYRFPSPYNFRRGILHRNLAPHSRILLGIPDSKTTESITSDPDLAELIVKYNKLAGFSLIRGHKKAKGPMVDAIAPSQSQYKTELDDHGNPFKKFLGTTNNSRGLVQYYLRNGFTVFFVGAHASPSRLHLPRIFGGSPQHLNFAFSEEPLQPDAGFIDDDERLEAEMNSRLLEVAREVSPIAIRS